MMSDQPYISHADLGGQPGHGPVQPEPEGELWHAPWEPRALALTLAMGATGAWNIDASRSVRERLPDYTRLSYYEIWLAALAQLMTERDLVSADELARGQLLQPPRPLPRKLLAADVPAVLARGSATQRPEAAAVAPARFGLGDLVRTRATPEPHHSRLPAYARGKRGTIVRLHGVHVFADAHAHGLGEQPQALYTVQFDAAELWGDEATAGSSVSIDAWDATLSPA